MPWLKSGINKILPSVIYQPRPPVPQTLKRLPYAAVVLDVGAGGRIIRQDILNIDLIPFANTHLVTDIHRMAVRDESVDCIFCTGVFEHIAQPEAALNEFHRVLKPGGIVHLEVPFMQPFHADPVDYYRWTLDGFKLFCARNGFEELESGSHLGPVSAMNGIIIAFWQSFFKNRYLRKGVDVILSFLLFPFKYLDHFLCGRDHNLSSGVYFVGKKEE